MSLQTASFSRSLPVMIYILIFLEFSLKFKLKNKQGRKNFVIYKIYF